MRQYKNSLMKNSELNYHNIFRNPEYKTIKIEEAGLGLEINFFSSEPSRVKLKLSPSLVGNSTKTKKRKV